MSSWKRRGALSGGCEGFAFYGWAETGPQGRRKEYESDISMRRTSKIQNDRSLAGVKTPKEVKGRSEVGIVRGREVFKTTLF